MDIENEVFFTREDRSMARDVTYEGTMSDLNSLIQATSTDEGFKEWLNETGCTSIVALGFNDGEHVIDTIRDVLDVVTSEEYKDVCKDKRKVLLKNLRKLKHPLVISLKNLVWKCDEDFEESEEWGVFWNMCNCLDDDDMR